jgi:hypothetical protein
MITVLDSRDRVRLGKPDREKDSEKDWNIIL